MNRTCIFCLIILMIAQLSTAQPPTIEWSEIYGGESSDLAFDVQTTPDGGFIFAGETYSYGEGGADVFVVRTDANGDTLWTLTCGGWMSESASTIRPTADGGWIVAGSTRSYGGGENDLYLAKIDSNGNLQWEEAYGGVGIEYGTAGEQTFDGGYIICGSVTATQFSYPSAVLIKTNSAGVQQWSRSFGVPDQQEVFYDVRELPDHGFILGGYNEDFVAGNGGWDAWIVKTDSMGLNPVSRLYGTSGYESAYSIILTDDGGYAFAGFTDMNSTIPNNFYLVKLEADLDTMWTRNYGRLYVDEAYDLIQTSDNGYFMTGHTCIPFFGDCRYDIFSVRTDANGDSLWDFQLGVIANQNEAAYAGKETADGGYILAGYSTSPDILDYDLFAVRLEGLACPDSTPRAPQALTIQNNGDDIVLMWQPVTESVADCPLTDITYAIYSDINSEGMFPMFVGTTSDTMYVDVGAGSGEMILYRVVAQTP